MKDIKYKSIALNVDMRKATWRYALWMAFCYAFQPVLLPVLIVVSRLFGRSINIGVTYQEFK